MSFLKFYNRCVETVMRRTKTFQNCTKHFSLLLYKIHSCQRLQISFENCSSLIVIFTNVHMVWLVIVKCYSPKSAKRYKLMLKVKVEDNSGF